MIEMLLRQIVGQIQRRAEGQRRNIGKAYALGNAIRSESKIGIRAIKNDSQGNVSQCGEKMLQAWQELKALDLPLDLGHQHDSEAGQEMIEFFAVRDLYCLIFSQPATNEELPSLTRAILIDLWQALGDPGCTDESEKNNKFKAQTYFQTWLAGIGDAVTEISKIILETAATNEQLTKSDYARLLKRYLLVADTIYSFLEEFETVYPMVINNSRRRGFFNTFRGLLMRIALRIVETRKELLAIRMA